MRNLISTTKHVKNFLAINNLGGGGRIQDTSVVLWYNSHEQHVCPPPTLSHSHQNNLWVTPSSHKLTSCPSTPSLFFYLIFLFFFSFFSFRLAAQSLLFGHFSPSFFLHLNCIFIYFSFINIPPLSLAMVGVLQTLHKKWP